MSYESALGFTSTGRLLEFDHNKLSRLERGEAYDEVYDAVINVFLRRRFAVTFHEVGFFR